MATAQRIATYVREFGAPVSLHLHDKRDAFMLAVSGTATRAVFTALDVTDDNWIGEQRGFFKGGKNTPTRWRLTLSTTPLRYIDIVQDGALSYVFAFGSKGTVHPIHTFLVPTWRIELLAEVMWMEIVAGRVFPALEALPVTAAETVASRWRKRRVTPDGVVNVRCVPSTDGNDAILQVKQPLETFVIPNAFNGWAQIVVGGTRGWVNESVVTFTLAR